MIDNSKVSNIPCRLHNVGEGGVAGADEVIDDNKGKSQQQINAEVDQVLGAGGSVDERIAAAVNVEKTRAEGAESDLDGRVDTLEEAVGTGGSVDSRIESAVAPKANSADVYAKTETYTKEEVHNLITTPSQEYVSVIATDQTTSVTDILPATGAADTIYRVGNWDGSQYSEVDYTEYAWNGSAYIKLSTKSQIGEVYDISANHADTKYADLAAALGTNGANIPQSLRKGGMSVKFVQSSDNKYVQCRLMANEWSIDTDDWAISDEGVYVDNPEFVYVKKDSENKILFGIKVDGEPYFGVGCPEQVKEYVEQKIAELPLDGYEDIVAFINGLEYGDKTLQELFDKKVDGEYVDCPEYIKVVTDKNKRILESTSNSEKEFYIPVKTREFTSENGTLENLNFDKSVGNMSAQNSALSQKEGLSLTNETTIFNDNSVVDKVRNISGKRGSSRRMVAVNYDDLPPADYLSTRKLLNKYGFTAQFSYIARVLPDVQTKEEMQLSVKKMIQDGNGIVFHTVMNNFTYPITDPMYDIRPDGKATFIPSFEELLPVGDTGINVLGQTITATTKASNIGFILNQHDFNILEGSVSDYEKVWRMYIIWHDFNVQGLLSGLDLNDEVVQKHGAIEWIEYFYNKLVDNSIGYTTYTGTIRERFIADYNVPSGGDVNEFYPDATHIMSGKIIRHDKIGATTRYTWYAWRDGRNVVYTLSDTPNVGDAIYLGTDLTVSGNNVASFSGDVISDGTNNYTRFSWSDVVNHLDSNGFQSAGYFIRGIYKDCCTTMNSDVLDRVFIASRAYFHYLFGNSELQGYTPHGTRRSEAFYNSEGLLYFDRWQHYFSDDACKVFHTRLGCEISHYDLFEDLGFKVCNNDNYNTQKKFEGRACLYEGQEKIRKSHLYYKIYPPYKNVSVFPNVYKNNDTVLPTTLSEVMDVMENKENYGRFLLDNADKEVVGQSGTHYTISGWLKATLGRIVMNLGTGMTPQLTFDSLINSAGAKFVMEQLYAFCYNNDIEIVNHEKARVSMINSPRRFMVNYFPNPVFTQTIKDYYQTTSQELNCPDGFEVLGFTEGTSEIGVADVEVSGVQARQLSINSCTLRSRIYGLVPGTYKFKCKVKKSGSGNSYVFAEERYNKDAYANTRLRGPKLIPTSEWSDVETEIVIKEPLVRYDNSLEAGLCAGYQENVCNIYIGLVADSGDTLYISNPSLKII